MSVTKRCVHYDLEAFFTHATGPGGRIINRPNPKYRICAREIAGVFLFFYTTSQTRAGKNYVHIGPPDWDYLTPRFKRTIENTKVEVSDSCFLTDIEVADKVSRNKLKYVGKVLQTVLDQIEQACKSGMQVNPTRARAATLPAEWAFDTESIVEQKLQQLGLGSVNP